jgi:hypothetical protein
MKRLIPTVLFLLLALPSFADITFFGYTGVADASGNRLPEIQAAGIRTNVATVDFQEVWNTTNLGATVAQFQASGVKAGLFLDHVLFKKFILASSPCIDENGQPFAIRLRLNWQDRLANFVAANGAHISPTKTAFISVNTEVNNGCSPLTDVQTAALRLKTYFPGVPMVMGYGRSPGARPAPDFIPSAIDWVGLFKYGTFDPSNPNHPNNADNQYLVEFNSLVSKLSANQRIVLVPDGWWGGFLHKNLNSHNGPGTGWPKWYLGPLSINYEAFALRQPKVIGVLFFLWTITPFDPNFLGTKELPQSVRDYHRQIACRNIGC